MCRLRADSDNIQSSHLYKTKFTPQCLGSLDFTGILLRGVDYI
nr:MAG TPA: hypothetical protein [Caudoviricetes sp.]